MVAKRGGMTVEFARARRGRKEGMRRAANIVAVLAAKEVEVRWR